MQEVDICNMALDRVGVSQTIDDLSDTDHLSRTCNRWYVQCRNEVLRDFPWGFANKAEALALITGQTYPGWAYVYQYPDECLAVRCVADENGMRYAWSAWNWPEMWTRGPMVIRYPWKLALKTDGASRVILSDVADAWAFHTAVVEVPNVFPPDFVSTLAWKLAGEVGNPVKADPRMTAQAREAYEYMKVNAFAGSLSESEPDQNQDSPSISCRY